MDSGRASEEENKQADAEEASSKEKGDDKEHDEQKELSTPLNTGDESPARPPSPDSNCSICLGTLENKSFTDSCFHTFCFVCLLEWSKVKAVCPLCKQSFQSIIHNVRSFEDYDQYHIKSEEEIAANLEIQRFRFRTTMTNERWWDQQRHEQQRQLALLRRPSQMTLSSTWRRYSQTATSAYRRRIYASGTRVSSVRTATGRPTRQRDVTPEFYRVNPACTHRLVPWLNRELNVLLAHHEDHIQFVLELIVDLIKRFSIRSEEFFQHIQPFVGHRTEHFIHEFHTFARSPYDMFQYDSRAVYNEPEEPNEDSVHTIDSSDDSSHDSDVEAIDPIDLDLDPDVIIISPSGHESVPADEATTSQDHPYSFGDIPYMASSFGGDAALAPRRNFTTQMDLTPLLDRVQCFLHTLDSRGTADSGWDSPTPGPSSLWIPPTTAVVAVVSAEIHPPPQSTSSHTSQSRSSRTASSSPPRKPPAPDQTGNDDSGSELPDPSKVKEEQESDSDFSETSSVLFVGFTKPFDARSPVPLSTTDDDEKVEKVRARALREKAQKARRRRAAERAKQMADSSTSRERPVSPEHQKSSKKAKKAYLPAAYRVDSSPENSPPRSYSKSKKSREDERYRDPRKERSCYSPSREKERHRSIPNEKSRDREKYSSRSEDKSRDKNRHRDRYQERSVDESQKKSNDRHRDRYKEDSRDRTREYEKAKQYDDYHRRGRERDEYYERDHNSGQTKERSSRDYDYYHDEQRSYKDHNEYYDREYEKYDREHSSRSYDAYYEKDRSNRERETRYERNRESDYYYDDGRDRSSHKHLSGTRSHSTVKEPSETYESSKHRSRSSRAQDYVDDKQNKSYRSSETRETLPEKHRRRHSRSRSRSQCSKIGKDSKKRRHDDKRESISPYMETNKRDSRSKSPSKDSKQKQHKKRPASRSPTSSVGSSSRKIHKSKHKDRHDKTDPKQKSGPTGKDSRHYEPISTDTEQTLSAPKAKSPESTSLQWSLSPENSPSRNPSQVANGEHRPLYKKNSSGHKKSSSKREQSPCQSEATALHDDDRNSLQSDSYGRQNNMHSSENINKTESSHKKDKSSKLKSYKDSVSNQDQNGHSNKCKPKDRKNQYAPIHFDPENDSVMDQSNLLYVDTTKASNRTVQGHAKSGTKDVPAYVSDDELEDGLAHDISSSNDSDCNSLHPISSDSDSSDVEVTSSHKKHAKAGSTRVHEIL